MLMPKISITAILLVAVLAIVAGYGALTYPKTEAIINISFGIGAESKTAEFDLSMLHDNAKIEVSITSGTALWNAKLISGNQTVWTHAASQGMQTAYASEWVHASPGHYKLVFSTIGFSSLVGEVKVTTKGGPW
jgi:hypothetical protein